MNKELRETREEQVKILANMVFGYQGSDPEIQKKQIGIKAASETLNEIIVNILQSKKIELE